MRLARFEVGITAFADADGWERGLYDSESTFLHARSLKPDVIVLDLSMPAMNGVPAASSAKTAVNHPAFGHVHYFDVPQNINEALSTGVTAVDSKSEPAHLVDKIQALLEPAS